MGLLKNLSKGYERLYDACVYGTPLLPTEEEKAAKARRRDTFSGDRPKPALTPCEPRRAVPTPPAPVEPRPVAKPYEPHQGMSAPPPVPAPTWVGTTRVVSARRAIFLPPLEPAPRRARPIPWTRPAFLPPLPEPTADEPPPYDSNLPLAAAALQRVHRGWGYAQAQEPLAAAHCFADALDLRPGYPLYESCLAFALCELDEIDQAVALFESCLEAGPPCEASRHKLQWCQERLGFRAAQRRGDSEAATGHLRAACALCPEDQRSAYDLGLMLRHQEDYIQLAAGRAHLGRGCFQEALEAFREAEKLRPHAPEAARAGQAEALRRLGERAEKAGMERLDREALPRSTDFQHALGESQAAQAKFAEAAACFKQAAALAAGHAVQEAAPAEAPAAPPEPQPQPKVVAPAPAQPEPVRPKHDAPPAEPERPTQPEPVEPARAAPPAEAERPAQPEPVEPAHAAPPAEPEQPEPVKPTPAALAPACPLTAAPAAPPVAAEVPVQAEPTTPPPEAPAPAQPVPLAAPAPAAPGPEASISTQLDETHPVAQLAALRKAWDSGQPPAVTYFRMGLALFQQGRMDEARKHLFDADGKSPNPGLKGLDPDLSLEVQLLSRLAASPTWYPPPSEEELAPLRSKLQADPANRTLRESLARCLLYGNRASYDRVHESLRLVPTSLAARHRLIAAIDAVEKMRFDRRAEERDRAIGACLEHLGTLTPASLQRLIYLEAVDQLDSVTHKERCAALLGESLDAFTCAAAPAHLLDEACAYLLDGRAFDYIQRRSTVWPEDRAGRWTGVGVLRKLLASDPARMRGIYRGLPWCEPKPSEQQFEVALQWVQDSDDTDAHLAMVELVEALLDSATDDQAKQLAESWSVLTAREPGYLGSAGRRADRMVERSNFYIKINPKTQSVPLARCAVAFRRDPATLEKLALALQLRNGAGDWNQGVELALEAASMQRASHAARYDHLSKETVRAARESLDSAYESARAASERGDYVNAKKWARHGIDQAEALPGQVYNAVLNDVGWLWYELGSAYKNRGSLAKAHHNYREALSLAVDLKTKVIFRDAYERSEPQGYGPNMGR